jgi:hypothetical protein
MMNRPMQSWVRVAVAAAAIASGVSVAPANAQVVQVSSSDYRNTVNFNLGYFGLRAAESRDPQDVLLPNLIDLAKREDLEPLEIGDFNGFTFGGEWLYGITNYIEVGGGVGYYKKTVETVYADLTDDFGNDIAQDLKLKVVPITATVRFLPLGRGGGVEPYVGGGIGIFPWRYTEIGEFVDDEGFIFSNVTDPFDANGVAIGPVLLAGIRAPMADVFALGAEFRWQRAVGDDLLGEGFLADKIDLGGWNFNVTFGFRF